MGESGRSLTALSLLFVLASGLCAAEPDLAHDWPWWRGPNSNGVAAKGQTPPTIWSERNHVIWKVEIPGRGHSSPTIVGERIFLTTADERNQIQGAICFDRRNGEQLWITPILEGNLPRQIHRKNTHASGTIACDGERIFTSFYNNDHIMVSALSLEGRLLWTKEAGPFNPQKYKFGYGASPLLYGDDVIVACDYDGESALVALKRLDGSRSWRTPRRSDISFSSPIVGHVAGQDQLLISGLFEVASYNPSTGEQLWATSGTSQSTCGTMVWDNDLVFASGGFPDAQTLAVKADGSGEVVWSNNVMCYEQSLLVHDGYVYALNDKGIAYCWRGADGEQMWRVRLGGNVSSSPILVGETIYVSNEEGKTFVFEANPERFVRIAQNQLGLEAFATPAFVDSRIYTRVAGRKRGSRQEYLYCLGE